MKHLHALEQLKIAHGGKQVKEFQFQYSRHHASCANMKRIGTSLQIQIKCIVGIEMTYLVGFVLVADEAAEKDGKRQFYMCLNILVRLLNMSLVHLSAQ